MAPPPDTVPAETLARPGEPAASAGTLSLVALSALVVGSMVGGGIFSLPQAFARTTGVFGAVIAWVVAGAGMLMLAFVFQTLSRRKPELDAGIYAYAKAGFGEYAGFLSAFGYWMSACLGNVAFLVLTQSTMGALVPALGEGDTVAAIVFASAVLWAFHVMLLRGIREATVINTIVTAAKMIPIVLFLLILVPALRGVTFGANVWGAGAPSWTGLFDQVRSTMLVTVFVFIGIEGASVYSRYARNRNDVGRATMLGFLGVLCLFTLVTLLSYGVMARADLAGLRNPSMAGVLGAVVGPWGAVFISVSVLVAEFGAFLTWSLLAAEVLFTASRNGTMPSFLARENRNGAPAAALWLTNGTVQVFLLLTLFTQSALRFAIELTGAMILVPYLLVAGYGLLLAARGESYGNAAGERRGDVIRGALATLYAVFLIFAGGLKFTLLTAVMYAPGSILFLMARREQARRVFAPFEIPVLGIILVAALFAVIGLASGRIAL